MLQSASSFFLLLTFLSFLPTPTTLWAQQPDELDRRDNERVRYEQRLGLERDTYAEAADIREAFIKNEMKEAQKSLDTYRVDVTAADRNFVSRIPDFHRAVADYRTAMNGDARPSKLLKELDRFVEAFKIYFRSVGTQLPTVSTSDIKALPREALLQETLTAAEHIDKQLDQARTMVQSASNSNRVTVQSELFMRSLNGEIYRLGAILSKLK